MTRTYEDPPEFRGSSAEVGFPRLTPVVRTLIWSNAIVFLAFVALRLASPAACERIYTWFELDPLAWRVQAPWIPIWQLVTYGFLHSLSDPFHILFNLLGVYFFGTMLESVIGSRRFLVLYLAAIVIGGAIDLGVGLARGPAELTVIEGVMQDPYHRTVGASGGVLATIVATAVLRPNTRVIFIIFPMTLKVLAMIMVGLDVFTLLFGGRGGTAVLVHLAGAAWGFGAVKFGWIWADPAASWERRKQRVETEQREADAQRLDRLLQQIHDQGMNSLSEKDRDFLRRMSARK